MSFVARHIKKMFFMTLAVAGGLALSTLPPKSLTAEQVKFNNLTASKNTTGLDVKATFIPAAHIMIEHGAITEVSALEPASGEETTKPKQNIYVSFVGGAKGDSVVIDCEIEHDGHLENTCTGADVEGPSRQMVRAGETLRSNLTVGPDVAQDLHDKDMTVVISFSYI